VCAVFTGDVDEVPPPPSEVSALAEISARVQRRFPDVPKEAVDRIVAEVHHEFDGHRIRDFIPILVERDVADRFRRDPTPG
jgi:phage terminase Nu1 subunit (DNA packaging protein)